MFYISDVYTNAEFAKLKYTLNIPDCTVPGCFGGKQTGCLDNFTNYYSKVYIMLNINYNVSTSRIYIPLPVPD
jgi:hypothetical protein